MVDSLRAGNRPGDGVYNTGCAPNLMAGELLALDRSDFLYRLWILRY